MPSIDAASSARRRHQRLRAVVGDGRLNPIGRWCRSPARRSCAASSVGWRAARRRSAMAESPGAGPVDLGLDRDDVSSELDDSQPLADEQAESSEIAPVDGPPNPAASGAAPDTDVELQHTAIGPAPAPQGAHDRTTRCRDVRWSETTAHLLPAATVRAQSIAPPKPISLPSASR